MNYVSKVLRFKIYYDKYFLLKWNILVELFLYVNFWYKEVSCVYVDVEMWVCIINDLLWYGEFRLVLKVVFCYKNIFYNVWV